MAVIGLSPIGNRSAAIGSLRAGEPAGWPSQGIEFMRDFFCLNSVSLAFSLSGIRLSAAIYKICTFLSTSFVENITEANPAIGRKALSGAVFGATARAHW